MAIDGAAQPVRRLEFRSHDEGETEEIIRQLYVGNRCRFLDVPDDAQWSATVAEAVGITADDVRSTVSYAATTDPFDHFIFLHVYHGYLDMNNGRDETITPSGHTTYYPLGVPMDISGFDVGLRALRLPAARLAAVAEETAGIRAGDLRFGAATPVSATRDRQWSVFMRMACDLLLADDSVAAHPIVAEELARSAAVTALHTFPNTALTLAYQPGPGWVAPLAVRRAEGFIHAHADQPLTLAQIAAAAGVSGRTLQEAFRRSHDTTPIGYLRRVRLEQADAQLRAADPVGGLTVAQVAHQWGWASASRFAAAYRRRFGVSPSHTLRR